MLETLRRIVQEVNNAKDLNSSLGIIVDRVYKTLKTQACSIYLLDNAIAGYVLMATEGLNKSAVGHVSLGLDEGIVSQVAKNAEPINTGDAQSHTNYHYISSIGEEPFCAFLGVPIIHHRKVLGVLVVQHREQYSFDEGDEAFLVTLCAQLAGVIAHAEATGAIAGLSPSGQKTRDTKFAGIAGAAGVAIGKVVVMFPLADLKAIPPRPCDNIKQEIKFFRSCLKCAKQDIYELSGKLKMHLRPEERELFSVYLRMLDDNTLGGEVIDLIKQGNWAQGALSQVAQQHSRTFEMMENSYMRERASDIKDLCSRILFYLQEQAPVQTPVQAKVGNNTILLSEDLTPAMLAEIPREKLSGLISVKGSGHSHVAILARAMGVPTVMGVVDLPYQQLDGKEVIVDGYNGNVFSNPSAELRQRYQAIVQEESQLIADLEGIKDLPCETSDQHRVSLWVNTGLMSDVTRSLHHGAEGIGLFRTEIPFMLSERFPSEQEQCDIYRQQLQAFAPMPVTMRTLDIGGDKSLPYFPIDEANPFLGWRGIRVTLDHPEIFISQARAMLKASEGLNNLQIMLPMIANVSEVEGSIQLIKRAYRELIEEGHEIQLPPIGVMVELPAAVYQIKALARRVQFISVGSNDLTQYLLAVDRNNPRVANLYNSFHPAILHALQTVVDGAHAEGRKVSICGEMAGDPGAAILLVAMGFDVLSMNATSLLKVKAVIRDISLEQAKQLLQQVMQMEDAEGIRSCVDLALYNAGVDRLLRSSQSN